MLRNHFELDPLVAEGPQTALERRLVAEYLEQKGYRLGYMSHLPQELIQELMRDACQYASLKLAEIEAKMQFRAKIQPPT